MFNCKGQADVLRETIEYHVQLVADESSAIAQDYAKRLRVASSFAPPPMEPPFFALLIINKDDFFPQSRHPAVSLITF